MNNTKERIEQQINLFKEAIQDVDYITFNTYEERHRKHLFFFTFKSPSIKTELVFQINVSDLNHPNTIRELHHMLDKHTERWDFQMAAQQLAQHNQPLLYQ